MGHFDTPLFQVPCIGNFMPWEVLPCKENDKSSIYELDFNGQSYCNLYDLRKVGERKKERRRSPSFLVIFL